MKTAMMKLSDLYREFGLSVAKLRELAKKMIASGRAKLDHLLSFGRGKLVYYLDRKVVIEYLSGTLKVEQNA